MVESNAAKTASTYAKGAFILAGIAVISAFVAPAFYAQDSPNVLTEAQIQESVQKAIALQGIDVTTVDSPKVVAIYEEIFEQDAWEAEAEVLALEELERKDYKDLGEFLVDIEDEDDIDRVLVKDLKFSGLDVDDKDATVELELKVYYEDLEGDSKKMYVTATADIVDGEVEDLSFIETD